MFAAPAPDAASGDDVEDGGGGANDWKRGMRGEGGNMIDFYAQRGKRVFIQQDQNEEEEGEEEEQLEEGPLIERLLPQTANRERMRPNSLLPNFYKRGLARPNSMVMNAFGKRGLVRPNSMMMNMAGKRGYIRPNSMLVSTAGKRGYMRPNSMMVNAAGKRGYLRPNSVMTGPAGKRGRIRPNGVLMSPQIRGFSLMRPNGIMMSGPKVGKRNPNRLIPTNLRVGKRAEDGEEEVEQDLVLERRALQADRMRDLVKMTSEAQGDEDGEDFVKSVRMAYYGGGGGGRWGRGLDQDEKFFPARG